MSTLEEYRARLGAEPLTLNQLGAVHREFERLGYDPADRAGRLAVSAALAGYPGQLATTKDLTMGEAGRLIGALRSCPDLAALRAAAFPPASPPAWSWGQVLEAAAIALQDLARLRR